MKNQLLKKSPPAGISLIATVLTLMIFALFIAIAVSLVTTGSNIGLQEEQGMQALFVADGGLEYTVKRNDFPNYGVSPAVNLGRGSFTVSIPTLSSNITNAVTTITVSSTEGFILNPGDPTRYWIMLCDNDGADNPTATPNPKLNGTTANCEKISFTGITATTFTGGTRGRDSSTADTHQQNAVVFSYFWNPAITTRISTRDFAAGNLCNSAATTLCVTSTANFESSGFVRIDDGAEGNREDVFYNGIGIGPAQCGAGCPACLGYTNPFSGNNCIRRAYDDNNNSTGFAHDSSDGGGAYGNLGAPIYQSEISMLPLSTGIIPGNPLTGNIQRRIQISVLPLK